MLTTHAKKILLSLWICDWFCIVPVSLNRYTNFKAIVSVSTQSEIPMFTLHIHTSTIFRLIVWFIICFCILFGNVHFKLKRYRRWRQRVQNKQQFLIIYTRNSRAFHLIWWKYFVNICCFIKSNSNTFGFEENTQKICHEMNEPYQIYKHRKKKNRWKNEIMQTK